MVKKAYIWAVSCIAAAMLCVAVLHCCRKSATESSCGEQVPSLTEVVPPQAEPLTDDELLECSRAFEDMGRAYSSRQFEVMQDVFCGISNKIARIGRGRLDNAIDPLRAPLREGFWHVDGNLLVFADVSEFDRYIRTNVSAVEILGRTVAANDYYNSMLNHYDMVVYRGITAYLKKFESDGEFQLACSARAHLDEWKNYLTNGQSFTRIYIRRQLKAALNMPRWQAQDMGMKTDADWIEHYRDYALKFHRQIYGVVPKWLDEEFPLPPKGEGGM